MKSSFDTAYRAASFRYEIARLRHGFIRAAAAVALIAAAGAALFGARALVWLPVSLAALTFAEWRGVFWSKGARRGLLAGAGALLLPLSVLRPCCGLDAKEMGMACCVMPSACWGVGAAVGLLMSFVLPRAPAGQRVQAALGFILGATAVALSRCSMLFLGESIGLLGGIAAAVTASTLAQSWLGTRRIGRDG